MIPYATLKTSNPKQKPLNKVEYVNKLNKIFNSNLGKKIELTYYTRFESSTITEITKGTIEKCIGGDSLIIRKENDFEIINILNIIGYTILN